MVPFRLTHPGIPMKIPIHIDEGELMDLLSSQLKTADVGDNTCRWQARLMLHVGELLEICRQVADAPCIYSGRGGYVVSISQQTRRRAKDILQQVERRSERQNSENPITLTSI